jgi:hypothetical protein
MPSKVPAGVKVPTWASRTTAAASGGARQPASVQTKRPWSTDREGPCTPSGCQGERGSGNGPSPSRRKP